MNLEQTKSGILVPAEAPKRKRSAYREQRMQTSLVMSQLPGFITMLEREKAQLIAVVKEESLFRYTVIYRHEAEFSVEVYT